MLKCYYIFGGEYLSKPNQNQQQEYRRVRTPKKGKWSFIKNIQMNTYLRNLNLLYSALIVDEILSNPFFKSMESILLFISIL